MNFVDMLMYFARSNPEKQAIILPDRIVSFGMIGAGIRSVEVAITEASLDSRHIVAVRIENRTRHLIVVSALYRLGIVSISVVGNEDLSKAGVKVDAIISDRSQTLPGFGRLVLLRKTGLQGRSTPRRRGRWDFAMKTPWRASSCRRARRLTRRPSG